MADRLVRRLIVAPLLWMHAANALAHLSEGEGLGRAAAFDAGLATLLAASALLYAMGVSALWRKAGVDRGIRVRDVARFTLGWGTLAWALCSPLDELAEASFALHMVQHELLMVVAAPLIVLGRPLEAWAWALSPAVSRAVAAAVRVTPLRGVFRVLTVPLGAWAVHALALWIWHLPDLFTAALASLPLHVVQHLCFLGSALGFWWMVFGGMARTTNAASIAALFTTMLHTSALGALLTFAPTAWYAHGEAAPLGLSALGDQQLGGLVMWVPGGFAYVIAGLAIVATWLSRPEPGTIVTDGGA